jgi:hypothetical protein
LLLKDKDSTKDKGFKDKRAHKEGDNLEEVGHTAEHQVEHRADHRLERKEQHKEEGKDKVSNKDTAECRDKGSNKDTAECRDKDSNKVKPKDRKQLYKETCLVADNPWWRAPECSVLRQWEAKDIQRYKGCPGWLECLGCKAKGWEGCQARDKGWEECAVDKVCQWGSGAVGWYNEVALTQVCTFHGVKLIYF